MQHTVLVFETIAPTGAGTIEVGEGPAIYLEAQNRKPLALLRWIFRHRNDFDILHIHTHVDRLFLCYLAARAFGWKLIYSSTLSDSLEELIRTYRPIYRPLARRLFRLVNIFVGISPRLLSTATLPDAKCRLIPQGVRLPPPAEFDLRMATRESLGVASDDIVLLYLGSICERKGVDQLVRTFAELAAKRPALRLVLVGPVLEEDYWAAINQQIESRNLADRITHIDFDPSPARYYAAADIFVFASIDEGFGNVLLEAMSHGLPVVSRYLDGVTEAFIEHGESGFLFSRADMFAKSLLALIDDVDFRQRVGQIARQTVRAKYDIVDIATRYSGLYQELLHHPLPAPSALARPPTVARHVSELGFRQVTHRPDKPALLVVIDTESEFDWSQGVGADQGAVRSIERLPQVQSMFERHGITPCYVLDYPVATSQVSAAIMRDIASRGAEIGAHLQPWTTPPFIEPIDDTHAFPGNLPLWLQRQKLSILSDAIENNVGSRPRIFKAGRYGIGAATLALLEDMGFDVDLSTAPGFDYKPEGGPDFSRFGPNLSWFGRRRRLLEIPTTSGFTGPLRNNGAALCRALDRPELKPLRMRGLMDRSGLLSRVRLSPEGYSLEKMKTLSQVMIGGGVRYLTLSFHSSSLQPGFTPYCSSEADVQCLLEKLEQFVKFFQQELHGDTTSPLALYATLQDTDSQLYS
ncbi:MAG: glycosyltransferase [Alphaproteobacteria bacterium]|nr:glycosyltransferase [Alphaproteobacteria bacterium]